MRQLKALFLVLLSLMLAMPAWADTFTIKRSDGTVEYFREPFGTGTSLSPFQNGSIITDGTHDLLLETLLSDTQSNTENRLPVSAYGMAWNSGGSVFERIKSGLTGTVSSFNGFTDGLTYCLYNSGGITLTTTQGAPLQCSSSGRLLVDPGTVPASQSGTWNVGVSAGSNLMGKVGIDQTTPGTTNKVSIGTDGTVTANLGTLNGASTAAKQPAPGTAGTASSDVLTVQGITSMTPIKTDGSGTTQPVSAASGQFASGAVADGAVVTLGAKADAKSTATDATAITIMQVAKQISASIQAAAASLAGTLTVGSHAVTNAGTFAVQATLQASSGTDIGKLTLHQSVNEDQVNGTTIDTNSGNKSAGTQRFVLATDQPALTNALPVSQATASSLNAQVVGATAAGSANAGNPLKLGAVARTSDQSSATTGNITDVAADKRGFIGVQPWALPENTVTGATTDITGTSATSVIAAGGAGIKNYIKSIMVMNSHATVGTWVNITDGSGGTILFTGYAGAAGGGYTYYPEPPVPGTANTAVYCQDVTTGANVRCNVTVFKGP